MHLLERLLSTYGAWLIGVVVGLEAMGLPLPGESMVIAGALFSAVTHQLPIGWVIAAAAAGAIIGDNAGYLIGRWLGLTLLSRYGRLIGLTDDRLLLGRMLFARYGGMIVFVGRFLAVLRTFAALLAGANRMRYARFMAWNMLGGVCWTSLYGLGAYMFGSEIKRLQGWVGLLLGPMTVLVVVSGAIYLKHHETRLVLQARSRAGTIR